MSQENVERVEAGFAAHNRGDLDFLVGLYHPEAVFETLLLGTHHGNEAIRVIYAENQKNLFTFKDELGRVTVRLDGRESSQSLAHVWKLQDGAITRFESFQETLATARVLGAVD